MEYIIISKDNSGNIISLVSQSTGYMKTFETKEIATKSANSTPIFKKNGFQVLEINLNETRH